MTRAAMIAAGTAGTMAALIDCGQSTQPVAFYGVPCTGDTCGVVEQDAGAADARAPTTDAETED